VKEAATAHLSLKPGLRFRLETKHRIEAERAQTQPNPARFKMVDAKGESLGG
jgi:hypothetical protein